MRVVLASKSPARLQTLQGAGLHPEVLVSGVDESRYEAEKTEDLVSQLATAKGRAVVDLLTQEGARLPEPVVVLACDSMLELEGRRWGKPGTAENAITRWYRMRGRTGTLYTGHHVTLIGPERTVQSCRVASTKVMFADLTDGEIAAYAATGEPQRVAGAFTIDGLGGAFVTRIEGDPHNVVGISLPLVRQMLLDLGVAWQDLWLGPQAP